MLRWLIQRIKAMLLCIVYAMLFVDTVNMKIKACNALNAMFVDPAKSEGYLKSLLSCGFSCSPVRGGSFFKRSLSCIDSINIYSIDCMIKKPSVSAFQNFFWIENWLNIKKVMGRNVWMCFVSTMSTYIALNALEILVLYRQYQHI